MKTPFIILALLVAAPAFTQEVEHAPTVAQCQADQRLWLADLEDNEARDVKFYTLLEWRTEMMKCEKVDPENYWKYLNTESEATAGQNSRQYNFLHRHGLLDQFLKEDAEGAR